MSVKPTNGTRTSDLKFRKHAAITYDARVMRFIGLDKVNLWTLAGRLVIPILIGKYQAEQFTHTKGQADLVLRHDGKWFFLVTVDVPDAAPIPATNFMGVDFGVVNIAMTEDGDKFSGEKIDATRRQYGKRRKALGRAAGAKRRAGKRPKNIRRATKRTKAKEARFRSTKTTASPRRSWRPPRAPIAGLASKTSKASATESRLGAENSEQALGLGLLPVRTFVEYKAELAGVPVVAVDPRNTSRTCPECGHCEKANRKSQSEFECRACGHRSHADLVGARNIGSRARASVTAPQHAGPVPA